MDSLMQEMRQKVKQDEKKIKKEDGEMEKKRLRGDKKNKTSKKHELDDGKNAVK